jgi:hypothetical protein
MEVAHQPVDAPPQPPQAKRKGRRRKKWPTKRVRRDGYVTLWPFFCLRKLSIHSPSPPIIIFVVIKKSTSPSCTLAMATATAMMNTTHQPIPPRLSGEDCHPIRSEFGCRSTSLKVLWWWASIQVFVSSSRLSATTIRNRMLYPADSYVFLVID